MEASENNTTTKKKTSKKILKITAGTVAILLLLVIVLVVFIVPAYVSSESGRKLILSKANASGAGAIDFTKLSMSWLKGISVTNISFKNADRGLSVAVKGVSTRPDYGALLSGNLSFGETVIDEPKVEIDVDKMKQKAAETQKTAAKPAAKGKTETSAGMPIKKIDLVVKDGDVKIKDKRGAVEVSNINTKVALLGPGEKTTLALDASIAGQGAASTVNARGDLTPGKNWDLSRATANITADVNNLSLSQLESLLAIAGVDVTAKGTVSAHLKGEMKDGIVENANLDVQGSSLEITAPQLKGDTIKTDAMNVAVEIGQQENLVNVRKMNITTDWFRADANGAAPMSLASVSEFMKQGSKNELKVNLECNLPAVAAMLPKTLGLNGQTKLTGGKFVGSVQTVNETGVKMLAGQVSIEGLTGTMDGKPVSLSEPVQVQAKISAEGENIKFEKVGVSSSFATVNCSGTTETFNYDTQIDLAKAASELGQFADLGKYKLAGQLWAKGQLTNNAKTTMLACSSKISNLRVNPTADIAVNEPNASLYVTAAIDKQTNVLLVKQFKADTSLGQFSVQDGRLPIGADVKEPISLTASAKGLDLAKAQPYLVMTKAISKDTVLGGIVDSNITLSSKEGSYKITTDSTKISNLLVKAPGKEAFTQNPVAIALDAEVNPTTKTFAVNNAEITSPDIKIKASVQQKIEGQNSFVQGTAKLDYDWKAITGILSPFMPADLKIEGKRQDSISFASKYPTNDPNQMLANLNAQTKVGFDKVSYMGLKVGTTNVDLKVDKGLMTIAPFTSTVNNGQLNFGGSADFKKNPAIFRTPGQMQIVKDVQLNAEMANKLLSKVNPIFSGASNVTGVANFQCDRLAVPITGGKPEDANIAGTISLMQVKMQSGLLSAIMTAIGGSDNMMTLHPTAFTVKDGLVNYTNMQMDIGDRPINFSGSVPIDPNRKIESFSVTLPVTALGKTVSSRKTSQAGRITAYIKGTPNKPKLDLGKMLQNQAAQTGLELLMEGAKKGR